MKVINLFGGPGTGKSTTASMLFGSLKLDDVNCELISEYAKGKVWEGSLSTLDDQLYIFSKQHHRQFIVDGQVDYAITDSPLLLSMIYGNTTDTFKALVLERFNEYDNLNVMLTRVKPYQPIGRVQTERDAIEIDVAINCLLDELGIKYIKVESDSEAHLKIRSVFDV